jgi:glycosyltransferase involved in cell wall biosynthesis
MDPTTRPRLVSTVHGLHSVSRYSRIMTVGERVIAVSGTVRDYILDNYPGVDPNVIRVIPRGVNDQEFPYGWQPSATWLRQWDAAYPQLLERRVLTLPGRITRLKGQRDFIHLIGALKARGLAVHGLVVGGEDPRRQAYARELHGLVQQQGLGGDITFTGHRDDLRDIFAVSELVLSLSTRPESFGRTVLEALSLGRPVIGYDHGGVGEILAEVYPDGRVPLGDTEALVERVIEVLDRPPPVPRSHPFTLSAMLDRTLLVYHELIAAR